MDEKVIGIQLVGHGDIINPHQAEWLTRPDRLSMQAVARAGGGPDQTAPSSGHNKMKKGLPAFVKASRQDLCAPQLVHPSFIVSRAANFCRPPPSRPAASVCCRNVSKHKPRPRPDASSRPMKNSTWPSSAPAARAAAI